MTAIAPSLPSEIEASLHIVGIGASAGGLEALTALIRTFTVDSTAFVVVQHLSPHHESMLPELLQRASRMPVHEIVNGMRVEPNHIYVSPADVSVAILHGVLHLISPCAPLPIDYFFRSLAQDLGTAAVGVVLSGAGSDGTGGLRDIKAHGGLAFCQEPASAKFASMPQSALDSGVVDRALPPAELGEELMAISHHRERRPKPLDVPLDELGRLFVILRATFGHDLSLYKPTTITRRIERRMSLAKLDTLSDYVQFAQESVDEQRALYKDLLISVTSFFRDGEPFEIVRKELLPRILERKTPGEAIRVWAPACAGGEEAYSLAICLLEALDEAGQSRRLQVFGTDVDEAAIARARLGTFSPNIELDVSAERRNRFFTRTSTGYQVTRRVRDALVFSAQNVAQDPPFSRLDLVSCRNVLIYLQPPLQKRVLRILHYALNPDGYLLLGNSETVGDCADLFSLTDRTNKVYVKKNLPSPVGFDARPSTHRRDDAAADADHRAPMTAQQLADRKVLERYAPPSVLVNENFDVLQFRGDTSPFVSPAPGAATLQLMKLLRAEIHVEVWRALQKALESGGPVRVANMKLDSFANGASFAISVLPIVEPETRSRCLLVVFELPNATSEGELAVLDDDVDKRVADLEEQLRATKEYLQTAIEELEASNEELKSTNEELQSSNEELQSTNEELETSKEELQSTNEELSSLNDENQERMGETARSKADLLNLLARIDRAGLFIGADLRVRRITDDAQTTLGLSETDIGRPLNQLTASFGGLDVEALVRRTTDRLEPATAQFRSGAGRWYELRVFPYRAPDDRVEGALVLVRDVHQEKLRHELVLNVEDYAAKLLAAIPNALAIVDDELRVLWVNSPFLERFRVTAHETIGNLVQNLGSGQWAHPRLRARMDEALRSGAAFKDFEIRHDFDGVGVRTMRVSGSRIDHVGEARRVLLLSLDDVPTASASAAEADA